MTLTPLDAIKPGDIIVTSGVRHTVAARRGEAKIDKNNGPGYALHTTTGTVLIVPSFSTLIAVANA